MGALNRKGKQKLTDKFETVIHKHGIEGICKVDDVNYPEPTIECDMENSNEKQFYKGYDELLKVANKEKLKFEAYPKGKVVFLSRRKK